MRDSGLSRSIALAQSWSTLALNPESVTETYPGSGTRANGRNTLFLNPEPEKNTVTPKPELKEHTLPLETEPVKEIHPIPKIRA